MCSIYSVFIADEVWRDCCNTNPHHSKKHSKHRHSVLGVHDNGNRISRAEDKFSLFLELPVHISAPPADNCAHICTPYFFKGKFYFFWSEFESTRRNGRITTINSRRIHGRVPKTGSSARRLPEESRTTIKNRHGRCATETAYSDNCRD